MEEAAAVAEKNIHWLRQDKLPSDPIDADLDVYRIAANSAVLLRPPPQVVSEALLKLFFGHIRAGRSSLATNGAVIDACVEIAKDKIVAGNSSDETAHYPVVASQQVTKASDLDHQSPLVFFPPATEDDWPLDWVSVVRLAYHDGVRRITSQVHNDVLADPDYLKPRPLFSLLKAAHFIFTPRQVWPPTGRGIAYDMLPYRSKVVMRAKLQKSQHAALLLTGLKKTAFNQIDAMSCLSTLATYGFYDEALINTSLSLFAAGVRVLSPQRTVRGLYALGVLGCSVQDVCHLFQCIDYKQLTDEEVRALIISVAMHRYRPSSAEGHRIMNRVWGAVLRKPLESRPNVQWHVDLLHALALIESIEPNLKLLIHSCKIFSKVALSDKFPDSLFLKVVFILSKAPCETKLHGAMHRITDCSRHQLQHGGESSSSEHIIRSHSEQDEAVQANYDRYVLRFKKKILNKAQTRACRLGRGKDESQKVAQYLAALSSCNCNDDHLRSVIRTIERRHEGKSSTPIL